MRTFVFSFFFNYHLILLKFSLHMFIISAKSIGLKLTVQELIVSLGIYKVYLIQINMRKAWKSREHLFQTSACCSRLNFGYLHTVGLKKQEENENKNKGFKQLLEKKFMTTS